jgi:hypothetical protein
MHSTSVQSSPRSISFTASADLLDADGIKTTIATAATAQSYSGVAINGAYAAAGVATPAPNGHTGVAQWPLAAAASHASSYINGSKVVFTGTYGGEIVQRTATVVGTDGNVSFIADGPLETCTQIDVEAQHDTSGAWTFGFTDLAPRKRPKTTVTPVFRTVYGINGSVSVVYGSYADLLPCAASGTCWTVEPTRVVQATTTCAVVVLE